MVFYTVGISKRNNMKKLLILLLLLPFFAKAQTTYQLNYDSIRVNKTAGTGGTSLYGKVYLKNVTARSVGDSILTVVNGRIFKVPYSGVNLWSRTSGMLTPATSTDSLRINGKTILGNTVLIGTNTPIAGGVGSLSPLEVNGTSGGTGIAIADNNLAGNAETYVAGFLNAAGGNRKAAVIAFRKGADTTANGYYGVEAHATKLTSGVGSDKFAWSFFADNGMAIFPGSGTDSFAPGYKIHRIYGYTAATSFGVGTAGTDSIEVHDNVTKQTKLIPGNYYATAASIPTQYWQRSGTTLSPLTSGDNILTTGNITGGVGSFTSSGSTGAATITQSSGSGVGLTITKGGNGEGLIVNKTSGSGNAVTVTGGNTELVGLTASSASVTASNGVSGAFANNATSFETLRATNSGSGLIASFRNSGGEVASISNSGGAIFSNQITVSTTSLPSAIAASSTNTGGRVLTLLGESLLEPLGITQKGSGPLATFGTSDGTTYVGQSIIRNNGSIYTRGQLEVGNLLEGAATDSVMVHRAIDLTVRRVPTTGTGSAVFSASPTFTTGATIDAGTSDINFGSTSNYGYMTLNNDATLSGMLGIFGGASGDLTTMYVQAPSGGSHVLRVGSTDALQTNSVGDLTIAGSNATKASGTAWINPSDSRLKTNIRPYTKGLSEVLKIEPKVWNFNKASGQNMAKDNVSVIAQELQKVMPEMVVPYKGKLNGKDADLLSVDGSDYTMLLINAVKEQQAIIEKLKERITALESK
jgi:hypothetical protein